MRVALGQLDMRWEDKKANLLKVEEQIKKAIDEQAELIVFPEMSLTGFSMNLAKVGEDVRDSMTIEQCKKLARRYQIAIGIGWAALPDEGEKEKGTNRFSFIDETGVVLGEYCKIHPFRYGGEDKRFRGGDRIVTVPFHGRTIALFICYDLRFPEIFQVASKDADVILVIANWPVKRIAQWRILLQARAIENQSYVVGVNCFGNRDEIEYSGNSMAVDAMGNILGETEGKEDVLVCELDDRAVTLRRKFSPKQDRREALYSSMFAKGYKKL